jgi:hypothetical protein
VAAELDGHVAVVRDRNEHEPRFTLPTDAKSTQRDVAHDAPRHEHLDPDAETQLHVDATTAERARRQEDEDTMMAWFRASGWSCAECQDRALAGAKRHPCRHDLKPRPRRGLPADRSSPDVDDDPFSTVVPQLDHSRPWCVECELCGRDRKGDAGPAGVRPLCGRGGRQDERGEAGECEGRPHRAIAVNVTLAV